MADIVELKTRPAQAQESVVSVLESLLEAAKKGEIACVAVAGVDMDGSLRTSWSTTENAGTLLGSIARLQFRYNMNLPFTLVDDEILETE